MRVVRYVHYPWGSEIVGPSFRFGEPSMNGAAGQPHQEALGTYSSSRESRHEPHHSMSGHVRANAVMCSNGNDASSSTRRFLSVCPGELVNNGFNAFVMGSRFLAADPEGQMHA